MYQNFYIAYSNDEEGVESEPIIYFDGADKETVKKVLECIGFINRKTDKSGNIIYKYDGYIGSIFDMGVIEERNGMVYMYNTIFLGDPEGNQYKLRLKDFDIYFADQPPSQMNKFKTNLSKSYNILEETKVKIHHYQEFIHAYLNK